MAQPSAPLHSPQGRPDEGVACKQVNLIKNESPVGEHQVESGAAIVETNNNSIPPEKINNNTSMEDNNNPPSLQSSADDEDVIMGAAATSSKPLSGGETHVERSQQHENINSADTVAIRTDAATNISSSNSNNEGIPNNPLAAKVSLNLQSPADEQAGGDNVRQQKIRASIQHRRQLLAWVRESRIACEQSRNNISSGKKKGFVAALSNEHSNDGEEEKSTSQKDGPSSSVGGAATSTSAEEIANYKKISKRANSAIAQQRRKSTNTISKSTNTITAQRDLRRGSSTGKRMSTAAATLDNVGVKATADVSKSKPASVVSNGGTVSSSNIASTTAASIVKAVPNKASSIGKQIDSLAGQSSLPTTQPTKVPTEKTSKKARKRAIGIKKTGISTNGSLNNVAGTTLSKSTKAVVPIDNSIKPLTLSSSAIRLRDRRDELAQKLNTLLQKQYNNTSGMKRKVDVEDDNSVFSPRKRSKDVKKVAQSSLTKLLSLSEMGTAREASRLPPRRMTQWDCVLEEMRWMASDFIEERKWRVACGKTISSSVKEHYTKQKEASKNARGKSTSTPNKLGSTPNAAKIPSSLMASSAKSKKSVDSKSSGRRKMSISDSNPLYIDPSKDDVDHSRKISQLLSLTVSDHWDIVSKGAFPLTDESYKAGYERFRQVQEKLLGVTNDLSAKKHDNDNIPRDPPTFKELSFEEISKRLQDSVDTIDSLIVKSNETMSKERTLQKYRKAHMTGIDLTNAQLKAVHNIESIWETSDDISVSAVLGGDFGTGKTVVGCITLWKNRNAGPQLVLCSPTLLLRWKHELSKFDDLTVRVLGHDGSFFRADDMDKTDVGKSDVLLCDYTSFIEMADCTKASSSTDKTPDFVSLILDCRHPSVESGTKRIVEINRTEWWNRLVQFMMRFTRMNRVVIDHSWNSIRPAASYDGENDMLDCRIIAMKLAFLYDPATFYSTRGSIGKRVISWAKYQNKLDEKSPSLQMLRSLLATSMGKVFDSALICVQSPEKCSGMCEGNGSGMISNLSWEVRKCSLTTSQQIEYENYCSKNMFSFSAGIKEGDFAEALLILRRICFHATMSEVTTSLLGPFLQNDGNQKRSIDGSLIARQSSQISETCATTAKTLLNKSSKMRELLHVLTSECGHDVPTELLQCFSNERATSATKPKKMKVIILATLTEAQLMTSYFLSAVGLHHEVLISFQGKGLSLPVSGACSWAWCQNIISDFNDGRLTDGNNQRRFIDILVASPITLSSHCCGVGASSADFVISIDEDWSGREELQVVSLLSKLRAGEDANKSKSLCKFVKIVSENTCEDTFICKGGTVSIDRTMVEQVDTKPKSAKKTRKRGRSNSKKNLDEIVKTAVPMDVEYQVVCSGYTHQNGTNISTDSDGFLLPTSKNGLSDSIVLGSKILRHKNSSMSSVFCTQMNANDPFLSHSGGKICVDEVQLSSALYQSEHDAFCFSASRSILRSIIMPRSFAEYSESHPRDILSSRDVTTAPIRRFATTMSEVSKPILPVREESVQLFQPDKPDSSSSKGEKALERDSCEEIETEVDVVDDSSLLVYELSSDKLSKIENVQPEEQKIGNASKESFMNIFSSIFDATAISAELACDGHYERDASVLAPSFLPPLLDFAQSNVVEASAIPQDNGSSLVPTKAREEDSLLTNISIMSQLGGIASTSAGQTKHDGNASDRCGDLCSFEMETNPYSFSLNNSVETHDALSNNLAGCDTRGAISCQSWPSMNAMILLTEKKKKEDTTGEQERNAKKVKNKQFSKSSIEGDKLSMLHFKNEKIMRRATSATKKVKFDDAKSILNSVEFHSRINDLVSRSSDVSSSSNDTLSVNGNRKRKNRRLVGIKLPIGVKEPSTSSKFSSTFEDTSNLWSEKEDALLKEILAKYGFNWQLVSNAISEAVRSRRSPSQCRHRWESICDTNPNVPAHEIDTNRPDDTEMMSNGLDHNTEPSPQTIASVQKSNGAQVAPSHWIGNPFPTLMSQTHGIKADHVSSRITKLREASKKRRYTPISLLGATNTGAAISVRLASIHPSHAEAVHIARTDVSHGVQPPRKEMWPLELLDYTEKQRRIAAEQISHDQQRGPTNNHIKQTSQPPHHQSYPPQQPSIPAQHHSTSYHPSYDPYRTHHQQPPEGHPSTKGHS